VIQAGTQITDIARVIQLSVAPVFLISGVGALLAVLSARLGRTIDRARALEATLAHADENAQVRIHQELNVLSRRAKLIYRAILLGTTCALLVCFVIASLFISALAHYPISKIVGGLFIAAMMALIAALLFFLREVFLATRVLRIGQP
jgi:CRP-like cAMP-binding protein